MKIQKRIVSFLLSFVMLTGLTGMWCIPASANPSPEYYAFDVSSLSTSANGFTNKGTVGDSSGKYVRFSPSEEMIYDPGQHYIRLDIRLFFVSVFKR